MSIERDQLNTDLLIKMNQQMSISNLIAVSNCNLNRAAKADLESQMIELLKNMAALIDKSIELDK